jgi:hypothetical protein
MPNYHQNTIMEKIVLRAVATNRDPAAEAQRMWVGDYL